MESYNVRLMCGAQFTDVPDSVMFQMLEQLNVRDVASYETGEVLYQSKAAKAEDGKVSGITRAKSTTNLSFCPWRKSGLSSLMPTFLLALTELTMNSMQRSVSKEVFLACGTMARSMTKFVCITTDVSFVRLFWDTKSFCEKGR